MRRSAFRNVVFQRAAFCRVALSVVSVVVGLSLLGATSCGASPTEKEELAELIALQAEADRQREAFEEARGLEQEGDDERAFLLFLSVDGGEFDAADIARSQAAQYLKVLERNRKSIPAARRSLIEAELRLALGDDEQALTGFRDVAKRLAAGNDDDWKNGSLPSRGYFVDHGVRNRGPRVPRSSEGSGSHSDNWLIRRFIALDALEDAHREYERVWKSHRADAEPHVVVSWNRFDLPVEVPGQDNQADAEQQARRLVRRLVRPTGFSMKAMRFGIDYGEFLLKKNDHAGAKGILFEIISRLDMDRSPNRSVVSAPLKHDEGREHPVQRFSDLGYHYGLGSVGLSRGDFLRRGYGILQSINMEQELVDLLEARIAKGENRLRRVLARVRLLQQRPDDAMALELAYLDGGEFDDATKAFRKAMLFDEARQPEQAIIQAERTLELIAQQDQKTHVLNTPDSPEPSRESAYGYSQAVFMGARSFAGGHSPASAEFELVTLLERLHAGQGNREKSLEYARRQVIPRGLTTNLEHLQSLRHKHRDAGQVDVFDTWFGDLVARSQGPDVRATAMLLKGDTAGAIEQIMKLPGEQAIWWKSRFTGETNAKQFLVAYTKAFPNDTRAKLELLDLQGDTASGERIERLELLLNSGDFRGFRKGGRFDDRFDNPYLIALEMMRLCVEQKQFDTLQRVALQLARHEKPFEEVLARDDYSRSPISKIMAGEMGLALAIQHAATDEQFRVLGEALGSSRWVAAKAQVARRLSAKEPMKDVAAVPTQRFVPWVNLPAGVHLYASNENVLSLARDDQFVYAGHPWGIAVYDFRGTLLVRIALGDAARAIAVADGSVWVGTPRGLFRVTRDHAAATARPESPKVGWSVAHQLLDGDVPPDRRYSPEGTPGNRWFDSGVYTLTAGPGELWIGLHRNVQVLNTKALTLRAFSFEEMEIDSWGGFDNILLDGRYVWADSPHSGLRRFDRQTETWSGIPRDSREPVRLTAIVEGQVWGSVYLDDQLRHRPCKIDRDTMAVTPVRLASNDPSRRLINERFRFIGQRTVEYKVGSDVHRERQLVLGGERPQYALDPETNSLRELPEHQKTFPPRGKNGNLLNPERHASHVAYGQNDERLVLARFERAKWQWMKESFGVDEVSTRTGFGHWCGLTLPDGTQVLGARQNDTRYEYSHEDSARTAASAQREVKPQAGGLFFAKDDGDIRRVSSQPTANSLPGDNVFDLVAAPVGEWACTSAGVVHLERPLVEARPGMLVTPLVTETLDRLNGLCANRVVSGVVHHGKDGRDRLYLATGYEDSSGGLAILDLTTKTFQALTHLHGLPTDKLDGLSLEGDKLTITFGPEFVRFTQDDNNRYRRFPPATLDLATNTITLGAGNASLTQAEAEGWNAKTKPEYVPLPFLGGWVKKVVPSGDAGALGTYRVGTRGIMLIDAGLVGKDVEPEFAPLGAKVVSPSLEDLLDTKGRKIDLQAIAKSDAAFTAAITDHNLLHRTRVLAELFGNDTTKQSLFRRESIPVIGRQLAEPALRLRATALYVLSQAPAHDDLIVPFLKMAADDKSVTLRTYAVIELVRRGQLPNSERLHEAVRMSQHSTNFPWGIDGSRGVIVNADQLIKGLIGQKAASAIDLVFDTQLRMTFNSPEELAKGLAAILCEHPDRATTLLAAYGTTDEQFRWRRDMARDIFQQAGTSFLPVLQEALKSKDRIVCSNAARACGAIGDTRAIPWLIEAAKLESGLSRASIVWALGQLKAIESLPLLASLYTEMEAAEKRGERVGHLGLQQIVMFDRQMADLGDTGSLRTDWDELKRMAKPRSSRPESVDHEDLISSAKILDAIRNIGVEHMADFYRALAASSSVHSRVQAAEQLASTGDSVESVRVLKGLLGDADHNVKHHAAISLIQMGDKSGERPLLESLADSERANMVLHLFHQRTSSDQRNFAKASLLQLRDHSSNEMTRDLATRLLNDSSVQPVRTNSPVAPRSFPRKRLQQ